MKSLLGKIAIILYVIVAKVLFVGVVVHRLANGGFEETNLTDVALLVISVWLTLAALFVWLIHNLYHVRRHLVSKSTNLTATKP